MSTREFHRIAGILVKEYGAQRALRVAKHCETLLALHGHIDGLIMWKAVLRAAQEIVRTERDVGEPLN